MVNNSAVEAICSATYLSNYLDTMEALPDDLQRNISQLRELHIRSRGTFLYIFQGFYSSDKIKFQEYSRKFPRVTFWKEIPMATKILLLLIIANGTCLKHNLGWNVQVFYSPWGFQGDFLDIAISSDDVWHILNSSFFCTAFKEP